MPDFVTTSFTYGEFAPQVQGRIDLPQYRQATESLKNMLVLPLGSARKRPGTVHVRNVAYAARIITMQIGANESIILELLDGFLKGYDENGTIILGDTGATIAAPWDADNLWDIRVVQSKFEMVFVSPYFQPHVFLYNTATPASSTLAVLAVTPPSNSNIYPVFANSTNNRPRTVAYSDERLIFGGTALEQNVIWGSAIKGLFRALEQSTAVDFNSRYVETQVASLTAASATISVVSNTNINVGDSISGSNIASGTSVASKSGTTAVVMTKPAEETASSVSLQFFSKIIVDDDPYTHIILDSGYIDIQWLRSTSTVQEGLLIAGTTWGVYAIMGLNEAGAISPVSIISARQQSSTGCSKVPPVLIGNVMVYVDSSKKAIRLLQFNLQGGGFDTPQVNELAMHLFDSDVKEMHLQRAPNQRVWVLLENGKVLTFSYTADGSLAAWTPMDFGLTVDSIALALGEEEDSVFMVLNDDGTRSIVKMASFTETDQTELVYSDRAVRKADATAFTTVDGLDHLEGEEVVVFADGSMHPNLMVEGGEVELNRSVNTAIVGMPYRAEIKTLPIPESVVDVKRVSKIFVRFLDTLGARADTEEFEEIVPFREGNFIMGQMPALFTGIKEIPYQGRHDRDGVVSLYSDDPTPFHVLNLINRLEVYR